MTMIPEKRKCPSCKKIYSWNPDVGRIRCSRCGYSEFEIIDDDIVKQKADIDFKFKKGLSI